MCLSCAEECLPLVQVGMLVEKARTGMAGMVGRMRTWTLARIRTRSARMGKAALGAANASSSTERLA